MGLFQFSLSKQLKPHSCSCAAKGAAWHGAFFIHFPIELTKHHWQIVSFPIRVPPKLIGYPIMYRDAFPAERKHCSWPFLERNEIFSPLKLNKISVCSTLSPRVSHTGIVKQAYTMNPPTWLQRRSGVEIDPCSPLCVTCSGSALACSSVWREVSTVGRVLCHSLSLEQVASPCSKLPRAWCTWLSHRHIPGERSQQARTEHPDSDTLVQQPQV